MLFYNSIFYIILLKLYLFIVNAKSTLKQYTYGKAIVFFDFYCLLILFCYFKNN